jgi:hypothetical protein
MAYKQHHKELLFAGDTRNGIRGFEYATGAAGGTAVRV